MEDPLALARLVLRDPAQWNETTLQAVLDGGETKTVFLPEELPVYLLYLTAIALGDEVRFFRDVYDRDGRVLAALDREPTAI